MNDLSELISTYVAVSLEANRRACLDETQEAILTAGWVIASELQRGNNALCERLDKLTDAVSRLSAKEGCPL